MGVEYPFPYISHLPLILFRCRLNCTDYYWLRINPVYGTYSMAASWSLSCSLTSCLCAQCSQVIAGDHALTRPVEYGRYIYYIYSLDPLVSRIVHKRLGHHRGPSIVSTFPPSMPLSRCSAFRGHTTECFLSRFHW